ncbi:MAG TPA: polysaccharide biosynthesis/export family protein, partial [Verrucomicrobiae bacterium]|nr:polysaccharide biosynthesis/export family protein [Verrucomicrobiae bacterium]
RTEGAIPNQFTPREYSDGTLYAFMQSGDVLRSVVAKSKTNALLAPLHITTDQLAKSVSVVPLPNPDWVLLQMKTFGGMRAMAELINLYGREVVDYTREVQRKESRSINTYLRSQLIAAETRISEITAEIRQLSDSGYVAYDRETDEALTELRKLRDSLAAKKLEYESLGARIESLNEALPNTRLLVARQELNDLLLKRTEKHPDVIAKRAEIAQLEQQQASPGGGKGIGTGNSSNPIFMRTVDLQASKPMLENEIAQISARITNITSQLTSRTGKDNTYAIKKAELDSSQKARDEIAKAERESRLFADASLGYFDIREEASAGSIDRKNRWLKVSLLALASGLLGILITAGIALVGEMLDTTLKTTEDIMRVTRLPVLASLGDLRKMSAQQQVNWAFRTLTLLKGKLSRNRDQALVCGIISANHSEGRSTWVNLLVSAASQRGLRVLTVDTRPTSAAPSTAAPHPAPEPVAAQSANQASAAQTKTAPSGESINLPDQPPMSLSKDVLSSPEQVAEQLEDPKAQPVVHIPLPGWVWNLERRKQWQKALESWRNIDNLVIFVELPPACESESVLLAEHLPQLIWLVGSGMADAAETTGHLDTLRHARCNLVGAVLNYAPPPVLNSKIGRWLNRASVMAMLAGALVGPVQAADRPAPAGELQLAVVKQDAENLGFSANAKRTRAKWQQRLTFGPGDVLDVHLYGNPSLSRTNLFVGPDGRISYLQATGVTVSGLTVEELRQKLDAELANYYPAARTIVLPISYNSKKYFMLGKVNSKGAFTLDRPLTLLEAVGRAKGLETGLYQRTTVEMADLGHSFLVRDGQKIPVNFEKLFLEGDLSQNVPIEPNDYIFFASTGAKDIYVLGEVMSPGPLGFVQDATLLSAITDRGGFSDRAYKRRVLVVRGSLNEPETFVINSGGALEAHLRDFRLQPRDIVYVSRRPWVKAEELLDEAASSFIQGAVTTWAGVNVGPLIKHRIFPRAR